jgi:hypothetical protein
MQTSDTIRDARRRIEDAATLFRYKSRAVLEEYAELGWQWTDSRAVQFARRHIQPQEEGITQAGQLCRIHAETIGTAAASADAAEREIRSGYGAQEDFEVAAGAAEDAIRAATDLAARTSLDASGIAAEVEGIKGRIASAAVDPGW